MSADLLTGKLPRCAAQRFVAKGASEQCLNEPHDLAKTRCRFASDAVQDEADRLAAELVVARRERDEWRNAHGSAAGVILAIEKSRDAIRADLAKCQAELADARIARDRLREAAALLLRSSGGCLMVPSCGTCNTCLAASELREA